MGKFGVSLVAGTCLLLGALIAWGAPITLDVNPAYVGNAPRSGFFDFPTASLNGLSLNGQTVSLDFVFADGLVARAIGSPENSGASLEIFATGASPDYAGAATTGYFLSGSASPQPVGRSISNRGSFAVYLDAIDDQAFQGLHFDLTLPATGSEVTGATLELYGGQPSIFASEWWGIQMGTPAQVPEPATLTLLSAGCVGLVLARRWRR